MVCRRTAPVREPLLGAIEPIDCLLLLLNRNSVMQITLFISYQQLSIVFRYLTANREEES